MQGISDTLQLQQYYNYNKMFRDALEIIHIIEYYIIIIF